MTNAANRVSDVQPGLPDASFAITPQDDQDGLCEAMSRHCLDQGNQVRFVAAPIGSGKTIVAAQWLLAHCARVDVRCA